MPQANTAVTLSELPRLTDEDVDALEDGYVAIEGVPEPRACRHCKGSGIDPSEAAKRVNRPRFPRLAALFVAVVTALGLTACSLTSPMFIPPPVPCSAPEAHRVGI